MASTASDVTCRGAISLRDSYWTTWSLFTGLVVLLLWRLAAPFAPDWLPQAPWWLLLILTGLIPQVFLLVFPFFARRPRSSICLPKPARCLVEFGIAIPVVIAMIAALAGANYILDRLSPGTSIQPNDIKQLSESQPIYLYPLLLFSFTFAPVAEEVFFRGFLQNAFRQRMSLALAIIAQSFIFGASHTFGAMHAVAAGLMGALLTLLYTWRKTLITPIFVHSGINLIAAIGVVAMATAYANSPVLGVAGDPADSECVVRQLMPQSAAENAGLRVGDVVISFNDEPIRGFQHLRETVRLYQAGDTIPVVVARDGAELEVSVVLQRRGKE